MDEKTKKYYDEKADEFIEKTINVDVSDSIQKFIKNLPKNGKVLDVGCGSGRDTVTFKNLGYQVTAFDASEKLSQQASKKINHPIMTMKIENIPWKEKFDGIWAMASLVHLPRNELQQNLHKLMEALKPCGTLFISLKSGIGEGTDENNRFFTYYSKEELNYPTLNGEDSCFIGNSLIFLG